MSISQQVESLREKYDPEILSIVLAHHFATSLMDHYGRSNRTSIESSIHLIDAMAADYAKARGHNLKTLIDAQWAVVKASVLL